MKKLYVFADFDWLKEPRLVGELSYESLRGSDSYGFCYSNEWLKDYGSLFLSDDLNNYPKSKEHQKLLTDGPEMETVTAIDYII